MQQSVSTNSVASAQKMREDGSYEPQSLLKARDLYGDLRSLIGNLNQKLSQVATIKEKEFLSAYRVHMLNVQLELRELKMRVSKAEENLQDDDVVSRMEEECNWFRKEKERLQQQVATMEKDKTHMKTRLSALKEQRTYLSNQLKAVTKRSRIFEADIAAAKQTQVFVTKLSSQSLTFANQKPESSPHSTSKSKSNIEDGEFSDTDLDFSGEEDSEEFANSFLQKSNNSEFKHSNGEHQYHHSRKDVGDSSSPTEYMQHHRKQSRTSHHADKVRKNIFMDTDLSKGLSTGKAQTPYRPIVNDKSKVKAKRGSRGEQLADNLTSRESLTKEDQQSDIARTAKLLEDFESSKSYVELSLEEVVRSYFNEVVDRRSYSSRGDAKDRIRSMSRENTARSSSSSGGLVQQKRDMVAARSGSSADVAAAISSGDAPMASPSSYSRGTGRGGGSRNGAGITGLGIEHFSETDRLTVMTNFLSNPEIFATVVRQLIDERGLRIE